VDVPAAFRWDDALPPGDRRLILSNPGSQQTVQDYGMLVIDRGMTDCRQR